MSLVVFYMLAGGILIAAFMVVTLRNVFHSALFLVITFFLVAGIYLMLDAEFLAAVQVLIYVGAVTILILFAIMLTHKIYSGSIRQVNEQVLPASIIAGLLLVISVIPLVKSFGDVSHKAEAAINNTETIGRLLMSKFVLPFEIVSVLLLAALIGAIVIARKDD